MTINLVFFLAHRARIARAIQMISGPAGICIYAIAMSYMLDEYSLNEAVRRTSGLAISLAGCIIHTVGGSLLSKHAGELVVTSHP